MEIQNANKILFRCSSLGYLMTEARNKSESISESTKNHLVDVYVSRVYGRETDISNKYIEKGLMVEEDSITLFNQIDFPKSKILFNKNVLTIVNEYISGTPDLFTGKVILEASEVIDIKSSFDIFTYFRSVHSSLNKMYYWQLQGYMALTGAKKSRLVYCLVNTPPTIIADEQRRLAWKMGLIDNDASPAYREACEKIEHNSIYDDIPPDKRCHQIVVERNDADIERLYARIKDCRVWMNKNLFKLDA